jgi:transcription termination factor Rho
MAIERAKRLVESGKDVVVLADSLTRLGRASQAAQPPSGRQTMGGWDPVALQHVRSFLGAARALKEGGSLTVVGTLLHGHGLRSDETLIEELRGMETQTLTLDRALADRHVFPALDIPHSITLHEEYLWTGDQIKKIRNLRASFPNAQGVLGRVSRTRSNAELLDESAGTGEKAG